MRVLEFLALGAWPFISAPFLSAFVTSNDELGRAPRG